MVLIRAKQVREKVKILDDIIKEYKELNPQKKRDYNEYEAEFKRRLKAFKTFIKVFSNVFFSYSGIDVRNIVNALTYCINVQARTSRHQYDIVGLEE